MPSRRELANAVRLLSLDAIQKAKSGHPGAPMGMADIAEVLWNDYLVHNPSDPAWPNRDRFVLSNGHASMLLYALLHLSGYDLGIEDIKAFRSLHSRTPGHPEHGVTPGVETTTGPLGQGMANAVGMAIAERVLAAQFNREGFPLVDHHTYVFLGDGCMMEGVSHEACSLAGTLGLGKLIAVYDDNGISIDGNIASWFGDDTAKRFEAYGWHVIPEVDGHDSQAVVQALDQAREVQDRPTLICCRTQIAYGSPGLAGSHKAHGAPLGEEEIQAVRTKLGWDHPAFVVPEAIAQGWDARESGAKAQAEWEEMLARYAADYPELAAEFKRRMAGELPPDFAHLAWKAVNELQAKAQVMATRKASKMALEELGPLLPELFGGSADLSGSNQTVWSGSRPVSKEGWEGNYLHYGVREFGMAAIMNGMALHGGLIPYGGTFLVFSDYARNAIRLSALMGIRAIHVLSHDSIGLGEDGPTHQPVEHASSLRLMPNLHVWRPCDTVESAVAWVSALSRQGPSALLFSRQSTKHQDRSPETVQAIAKGGYILFEPDAYPQAIVIATGSEVELAVQAAERLGHQGRAVRVVSMPCAEVFAAQSEEYRESVLPTAVQARLAVEAGSSDWWAAYVGTRGRVLGIDRFGESAPGPDLYAYFGLTAQRVEEELIVLLGQ
ncbi:transketolase [Desulfovermiculus halophilus]|jgi:transketolase|uniref:transketolase n=1 Tax=Desulfovermiculus halophilus TaxID=339722 RepID=UPI0004817C45|nr:transketolase [Desulfovermiculus halophilus]